MALPTDIRAVLEAGVAGMTAPPYNFPYGPVDVHDPALWVAGRPQVFLEEGGWTPAQGAQMVGKLTQVSALTFRAIVPAAEGFATDQQLDRVDEDIKRLMSALETPLRQAGAYLLVYSGSSKQYRLVRAWPGQISIRYALTWRQSRSNPAST